ncbi:hypothetical protein BGZ82_003731, partial [Podila clonocystis]
MCRTGCLAHPVLVARTNYYLKPKAGMLKEFHYPSLTLQNALKAFARLPHFPGTTVYQNCLARVWRPTKDHYGLWTGELLNPLAFAHQAKHTSDLPDLSLNEILGAIKVAAGKAGH